MSLIRMPNGDLIAQTDGEADKCPAGYVRDRTDPRRFHPTEATRDKATAEGRNVKTYGDCCRGL